MEQLFGYPEASAAARLSYEGMVELIAFPGGAADHARPVHPAGGARRWPVLYFVLFFVGPLQRGSYTHRNGGDPILLNAFLLPLSRGRGRRRLEPGSAAPSGREASADSRWAPYALGILRIVAGCLFIMHGLEKFFGVGGGRIDRDIMTMRGLAGWLENRRRAADHPRPLHSSGGVHPLGRDGGGLLQIVGAARLLAELPAGRAWKHRFCSVSCICSSGRQAREPGVSTDSVARRRDQTTVEDRANEGTTHGTRHHHGAVRWRRSPCRRNG